MTDKEYLDTYQEGYRNGLTAGVKIALESVKKSFPNMIDKTMKYVELMTAPESELKN